jgi:hypothetical protein
LIFNYIEILENLKGKQKSSKEMKDWRLFSLKLPFDNDIIHYCRTFVKKIMQKIAKFSLFYEEKELKSTHTWLYLEFKKDITDLFGNDIPYPNKHFINDKNNFVFCWLIDGFFDTQKGYEHLNDIIARFMLIDAQTRLVKRYKTQTNSKAIKLKAFHNLKSLYWKKQNNNKKTYTRADVQHDSVFWALKYFAEDLIREDGFIIHQKLEDFGLENFASNKYDNSTIKAKCRSIYYWYSDRDWAIGRAKRKYETKEELMASRSEHMKKVNKTRQEETKRKVINCVTGMFSNEYKKANAEWNISKIAKDSGTSRNTVYKYLKEMEA